MPLIGAGRRGREFRAFALESTVLSADDAGMRVFLDNRALESEPATMSVALDIGREAAEAIGRVIVEAKLNGRMLTDEELEAPSRMTAREGEVRLVSAEPRALVSASMREVAGAFGDLRAAQGESARRIQLGEIESGFDQLSDAITVWDSVRRVMDDGPRLLGEDVRPLRVPGVDQAIGGAIDGLARDLSALQEAIRGQDWSSVADILEGELARAADEWSAILLGLADRIERTR